ncbi:hypothetical protein, partial [Acaryochloris sp. IP29b_bin.137]|uniref:hypothetical protein n=1 Tax=Acaryochloris sp. IP29b_bin.137 TaxID=2969217 RepID=UPI002635B6B0
MRQSITISSPSWSPNQFLLPCAIIRLKVQLISGFYPVDPTNRLFNLHEQQRKKKQAIASP